MALSRADLKLARIKIGLTQSELAKRSLLNQREISDLETGTINLNRWQKTHPNRWDNLRSALNLDAISIEICRRSDTAIEGITPYIAFVPEGMADVSDLLPGSAFEVVFRG